MGDNSTVSAVRNTFGGGQSGQARATGAGNLLSGGSFRSDLQDFGSNPSAFLRNLFGRNGDGDGDGDGDGEDEFEDLDTAEFEARLNEFNPQFFNADFGGERIRGIADLLEQRGRGTGEDPAFDRFRESQFNIFESSANQERSNVASNLQRRGLGGSSTGLNQLANVDRSLGQRKEALGSRIGLQQLGRSDQALQQSLGAFGQAGAAEDLRLSSISSGLENLLAVPSLQIARQAAINLGKLPPEKEPGLLSGLFEGLF